MRVYSIYGVYRTGFLKGRAREAAEELIRSGQILACQGPEAPNSASVVTLLSRPRDTPTAPWSVCGKVMLHDKPQFPERTCKICGAHRHEPPDEDDPILVEGVCEECSHAEDEDY